MANLHRSYSIFAAICVVYIYRRILAKYNHTLKDTGIFIVGQQHCVNTAGFIYSVSVSITQQDIVCQRWDSQHPHAHAYADPARFSDDTLADAERRMEGLYRGATQRQLISVGTTVTPLPSRLICVNKLYSKEIISSSMLSSILIDTNNLHIRSCYFSYYTE